MAEKKQQPKKQSFAQVMEITLREAANENRPPVDTVNAIVFDLQVAGFAIRRAYDRVDYHLPIMVVHQPMRSGEAGGSFAGQFVLEVPSAEDMRGQPGFLVVWVESGRHRSAWFDHEGASPILTEYRVINPRMPMSGKVAELKREVA